MLAIFTYYLIAAVISATLATGLAHLKHRTWLLWGILCLFLPPLVFLLMLLPHRKGPAPYEQEYSDDNDIEDEYDDGRRDRGGLFW